MPDLHWPLGTPRADRKNWRSDPPAPLVGEIQAATAHVGTLTVDGHAIPGPGSDTTAVHVGQTTTGDATVTGDVTAASLHVGDTTVAALVPASVLATLALPHTESPDSANFPVYDNRYAVIVGGYGTYCSIVDCVDPAAPVAVATFSPHTGTAQFLCACKSDGTGLLALTMLDSADPGAILEIWDIATPASPAYVSTATGAQADQLEAALPQMFGSLVVGAISSNYATPAGLRVWSLASQLSPVQIGSLTLPATTTGVGGGRAAGSFVTALLARDARCVIVGDHNSNLYIVDVGDDTTHPAVVGSLAVSTGGSVWALDLLDANHVVVRCSEDAGTIAYVVVAIQTLASPVVVSTVMSTASDGGNQVLAALNSLVYLSKPLSEELLIFDAAQNPAPLVQTLGGVGALGALWALSPTQLLGVTSAGGSAVLIEAATLPRYAALAESMSIGSGNCAGSFATGSLQSTGAATARGHTLIEGGAVATETITPTKTITVYAADGTAYKIPAVLA